MPAFPGSRRDPISLGLAIGHHRRLYFRDEVGLMDDD
jgi:hypothetical protein